MPQPAGPRETEEWRVVFSVARSEGCVRKLCVKRFGAGDTGRRVVCGEMPARRTMNAMAKLGSEDMETCIG